MKEPRANATLKFSYSAAELVWFSGLMQHHTSRTIGVLMLLGTVVKVKGVSPD